MATMADRNVRVYEVGPRDGLQNEATPIPTAAKLRFIELLADAGLREIEATSFVSPKAVPQLADADELMRGLERRPGVRYPVLVPNARGLERAEASGVEAVCVFTAASEPFTGRTSTCRSPSRSTPSDRCSPGLASAAGGRAAT